MIFFIDTSFFIALIKQNDPHHQKARQFLDHVQNNSIVFYTSYYIIDEAATVLSMRVSKIRAVQFLKSLKDDDFPIILEVNEKIRKEAYQLFQRIKDKNISMIDCYSAELMKSKKIKQCLTFDQHFKKLGFDILN